MTLISWLLGPSILGAISTNTNQQKRQMINLLRNVMTQTISQSILWEGSNGLSIYCVLSRNSLASCLFSFIVLMELLFSG